MGKLKKCPYCKVKMSTPEDWDCDNSGFDCSNSEDNVAVIDEKYKDIVIQKPKHCHSIDIHEEFSTNWCIWLKLNAKTDKFKELWNASTIIDGKRRCNTLFHRGIHGEDDFKCFIYKSGTILIQLSHCSISGMGGSILAPSDDEPLPKISNDYIK